MTHVVGIEGIDGAGKSTVASIVRDVGRAHGLHVTVCHINAAATEPDEALDARERRRQFWKTLVTPELTRQYRVAYHALVQNDVVVLERTVLSYLMGRLRVFGREAEREVVVRCIGQIRWRLAQFVPWDTLWFVTRAPTDIRAGLLARQEQGEALSAFDRYLLDHPDVLREEQRIFRDVAVAAGARVIANTGTLTALRREVAMLLSIETTMIDPGTSLE